MRIQKERDYHRMHHRRVMQEKNKLIADVKKYVQGSLCIAIMRSYY